MVCNLFANDSIRDRCSQITVIKIIIIKEFETFQELWKWHKTTGSEQVPLEKWCGQTSLMFGCHQPSICQKPKPCLQNANKKRSIHLSLCQRPPWDICSYCFTLSLWSSCQIDLISFLGGNNHNSEKQRNFSRATYWSLAEPGFKLTPVSLWNPCLLPLNIYLLDCVRS